MSTAARMSKPQTSEHAEYFQRYIQLVPEGDILATLGNQMTEMTNLLGDVSETKGDHRYAVGKWSVKELVGHLIDAERVFAYRALRFARADATPIEGFEQDDYVKAASHGACKLADLVQEWLQVRRATISMFRNLDEAAWLRRGKANQNEVSVRAIAYIIAGHVNHHQQVLKEKYLPA